MVDYKVIGSIAVLAANNPPVNALSYAVRQGLSNGIKRAQADAKVKAIIIKGQGQTFPAGADIREFGQPIKAPWLTAVGYDIEASNKPVVAAIHGTALGGGLEIALFSHYRIALRNARVGFPEVQIGILPGAGGTQRLPRVAGLAVSMDMITSGRHVLADEALKYGIVDKVVDGGDIQQAGLEFANSVIGKPLDLRRLRNVSVKPSDVANVQNIYDTYLAQVKRRYKGFIAPLNCLKAVRSAAELPYEEGISREMTLFRELASSGQARALQYAFFAERSSSKWQMPTGENYQNCKPKQIKSSAVIGAGTMGTGIAITLVNAGISVVLIEQDEKFLNQGMKTIHSLLEGSVRLKRSSPAQMERSKKLLTPSIRLEAVKDVDIVIEAVYENLALKQEIFRKLDSICKPEAILCSNTSTLDIDKIASSTSRPDKVAGTHFFAPAYYMKLLENIYGTKTSGQTAATIMNLGKRIGKIPVLVKTCHGFVANRTRDKFSQESVFLVEEGAMPQDVDQVLEDLGMPMGPFKVSDLSGIDIGWRIKQELAKMKGATIDATTRFVNGERYSGLGDVFYNAGRYGRKTGKGFYRYEKMGGKIPTVDPEAMRLIEKHCQDLGIERRRISSQEILERCVYSAINECFRCLEEDVAAKPEDIDVMWLHGFGWPRYLGGPMFYASQVGLKKVYERIRHYQKLCPLTMTWVPSDLLARLSKQHEDPPMKKWNLKYASRL